MKMFLTPNPNPPYNLMTRFPSYINTAEMTEDEVVERAINRAKEVGDISDDAIVYIVDESELPDVYFIDAWSWED